nr:MAG: hypothetical protein [Bacteriophage sp.]
MQHRRNEIWEDHRRFLPLPCLYAASDDLILFKVNHIFLELQKLTGHHAGINHR